jgi:hypothetical protein
MNKNPYKFEKLINIIDIIFKYHYILNELFITTIIETFLPVD